MTISESPNAPEVSEIWSIVREIQLCKRDLLGNFLRLGSLLLQAQEGNKFQSFASHIKTFNDFLTEMDLKKSSAYNAMAVRREFGEELLANRIHAEPTRLVRLLPLRISEKEKVQWLQKAQDLPAVAFNDEIRTRVGKMPTDGCEHGETEAWERCIHCNKFFKR